MEKARKGTPQYEEWLRKYKEKRKASTVKKEVAKVLQEKKFSFNDIFASLGNSLRSETMQKSGNQHHKYKDWLTSHNTKRNKDI